MRDNFQPHETLAVLTFDLMDHVFDCDLNLNEFFKPAPTGLYIKNKLEPAFVFDDDNYENMYYKDASGDLVQLVGEFDNKFCDLYDVNGVKRIPKYFTMNKKKYLSYEPDLPYRAVKVAYYFAMFVLADQLGENQEEWMSEIKKQFVDMTDEEFMKKVWCGKNKWLESTLASLKIVVERFVSRDILNLYSHEFSDTRLTLIKGPDKRIKFYDTKIKSGFARKQGDSYNAVCNLTNITFSDINRIRDVLSEMGIEADIVDVVNCEAK